MKKFTEILILACALIFLGITIWFNTQASSIVGVATMARVPQGGTGWGSLQSNTVLLGNGTGKIGTSTGSTNGFVLALEAGIPTFVSTSSIGSGSPFAWTPTADGNSTSTRLIFGNGFISQASSTFSKLLYGNSAIFSSYLDASYFVATSTTDSTFPNAVITNATTTNATTTSLSVSGLFNIGGDYLNELCGTGLTCTGNTLTTSLGTSIDISSETNLGVSFPVLLTGDTLSFGGLSTSTSAVVGNIPYFSGVNTFDNVATTSATIGTGLSYSGTFGSVIGGGAGTLTLNATGDWTGTIDGNNFAGGAIGAGELIYGGSAGSFSELTAGTNGYVLTMSSGIPAWVASTTFSGGLTYSGGNVTADLGTSIDLTGEVVDNFTDGSVLFWGTTAVSQDNANLSYNDSLNRLTSTYSSSTALSATNGNFTNLAETNIKIKGSRYPVFTYASSSWGSAGTTTVYLAPASIAQTWNTLYCDSSTFLGISIYDGTNRMDYLVASSTVGTFSLTTNNSFTLGEARRVDIGTSTALGSRVDIACSAIYTIN